MSLPRYPKYKDSGAAWLGEVPEHWEIKPLKYIASLKGRLGWQGLRSDEYTDDGPFLVTSEHLSNDKVDWNRCYHVSPDRYELAPEIQLREGDLLMMKDGAAMGKLGFIDELPSPACLNSHLLLFRPLKGAFENRFLYYVLGGPGFNCFMVQERTGTTFFGISQESIGSFPLATPPQFEQHKILEFLDKETAKIDALVEEQRRLIELLKEKRRAVISHAVTKGLNPDAPMKDSGVEWLGDVPAHWSVGALRYFAKLSTGATPDRTNEQFWNGGIPWVKTGEVNYSTIEATEETVSKEALKSCSIKIAPPGTLLMALYGQGVTRGRVALLGIPSTFNQACAAIQVDERIDGRFLHAFFVFAYHFVRENGNETTQMNLNVEFVQRMPIVVPPLEEQIATANVVECQSAELDTLIAEATQAIDLLQERRTALISAAVTGKIDVRGLVREEEVA
jgi:type I restriction enzyme S subunit